MRCTLLKSKLHRGCVTHAELDYEGSCAIDARLLRLAGIHEYEQIQVYNLSNGERFTTYAIRATEGSRTISVNGAAAHKAAPGDRVIVCAYAELEEAEITRFQPRLVYLDEGNGILRTGNAIPVQSVS